MWHRTGKCVVGDLESHALLADPTSSAKHAFLYVTRFMIQCKQSRILA